MRIIVTAFVVRQSTHLVKGPSELSLAAEQCNISFKANSKIIEPFCVPLYLLFSPRLSLFALNLIPGHLFRVTSLNKFSSDPTVKVSTFKSLDFV